jgi:hypothetical protein
MNGVSEMAVSPFHRWLYRWGLWPFCGGISMQALMAWICWQGWKAMGWGAFQFLACCQVVLIVPMAVLWSQNPPWPMELRRIHLGLGQNGKLTYFLCGCGGSIVCLKCGTRSADPPDVAARYCGVCHEFHRIAGHDLL